MKNAIVWCYWLWFWVDDGPPLWPQLCKIVIFCPDKIMFDKEMVRVTKSELSIGYFHLFVIWFEEMKNAIVR